MAPAERPEGFSYELWGYERDGNLQDRIIGELIGGYDTQTRSFVNISNEQRVEAINADCFDAL